MQSDSAFVALGIRHSMHMRHIVMWLDQRYISFPYYLLNDTIFKKLVNIMCVF